MSGTLLRNIIFLFIINIVIKPFWIFGIDIPVQNTIGNIDYGKYISILNLSLIFQIILDWGLQTYQSRQVGSNTDSIRWLLPTALVAKGVLALIYLAALMLTGWVLHYDNHRLVLLFFLGTAQIFNSLMLYLRSGIAALHYYATDSILSVIDKVVLIVICGVLLYGPAGLPFKIEYLVYSQIAGYLISVLACFVFIRRKAGFFWRGFKWDKFRSILKKSTPYALQVIFMAFFFRSDVVILERMNNNLHDEQAGFYWEVYRLLDMLNNFTGILFAGLFLPMVMKLKKDRPALTDLVSNGISILLPIALSVLAFVYFYHSEVMGLYTHNSHRPDQLIFVMLLSYPFYSLNYIYGTLLTGLGDIKRLIYHAVICAALSIVLNLLLARSYGAWGTACISLFIHALYFSLNLYRTWTQYGIRNYSMSRTKRFVLFTGLITCLSYATYLHNTSVIIALILNACSSAILLLILKIIDVRNLFMMVRK